MKAKLIILIVLTLSLAWGQEFRATVNGRILDPSGANVPKAVVQVMNAGTNEIAATVTDAQGNYTVPFLRPGAYSVSVEVPGFKKFVRDRLTLNVGQVATLDISLEVGAASEQITVSDEAPLLDTTKSDRGQVINEQGVREFPLNGRNPFMLAQLVAGVNLNSAQIYQRPFDNGLDWSINGGGHNNEYLLDGAPNNAQAGSNNLAFVPPLDAVQEFKIQTNSYDSQYGHTSGGIINVSLKSGANDFHGTIYEFLRRQALDANSFQNNARGAPRVGHFLDEYGFQVGGPIRVPHLYDGRGKSFFMFAYEGYREGTPTPLTLNVPEPEFSVGDFSKLTTSAGQRITIYDPTTGQQDATGRWIRSPFVGNQIPANRLSPVTLNIMKYFPKSNISTPGFAYSAGNLFIPGGENLTTDDFYNIAMKFDQNFGPKHRMYFRNGSNDRTETRPTNGVKGPGQDGNVPLKRINDAYALDWVGVMNPSLIANVRLSFGRYVEGSRGDANVGFDPTSLGFPKSLMDQLPVGGYFGVYQFANYVSLGRYFSFNYTNTWALHPSVTKVWNNHTFKAGVDLRWVFYNISNPGTPWRLSFDDAWSRSDYTRSDALSGNSIASALLGIPSTGGVDYNATSANLYRYAAPYLQDDWKISRRLTLNLGLRWDVNMSPTERYNRINRSFDPTVVNPVDKLVDRVQFPSLPVLQGSLLFAGVNGAPRRASGVDWTGIQPRIGLAYRLTDKLVFRGGWGRYYINPTNDFIQNSGFSRNTPIVTSLDGGRTAIPDLLSNPLPGGVQAPTGASAGALTFVGRPFNFFDPTFKLPYVNQFSLGFQYQLPLLSRVDVSFAGNRSYKLQTSHAYNETALSLRQQCNRLEGGNPLFCDQLLANPFFRLAPFLGTATYDATTISRTVLTVPFPEFGAVTQLGRNDGKVWYNSLQVTYEIRSKFGLNLSAAYTLSKDIERNGFTDSPRYIMQQGLISMDRTHTFRVGGVWELPIGSGKAFLKTSNPVLGRLASGWQMTTTFTYNSGLPAALPGNVIYVKPAYLPEVDWSASRIEGLRPCVARMDDLGNITLVPFSALSSTRTKFGCSETDYNFLVQPRYAPRVTPNRDGRLRRHTIPQADMSVSKLTRITEKTSVQIRAEAFNVFNSYNMYGADFNSNAESSDFGTLTKATVGTGSTTWSRQVQLAVKFIF